MTESLSNNRNDQRRTHETMRKELVVLYRQSTDQASRLQYAMLIRHYDYLLTNYYRGN